MKFVTDDFDLLPAEKQFVDRAEPREVFWENYKTMKQAPMEHPLVLSFYGVGGIGKSRLTQEIRREISERAENPYILDLDFDFIRSMEPYQILRKMRQRLSKDYNFSFPMFDVAYYTLMMKIGEDMNKPEARSVIDDSPVLSLLVNTASLIPGADAIAGIFSCIDQGVKLLRDNYSGQKRQLEMMQALTPAQLIRKLPAYFALDVRSFRKTGTRMLIVFLDTYERLVNEFSSIGEPLTNDLWLRGQDGLIIRMPNTLWVISSREKLKWEQLDGKDFWDGVLTQYLLGTLSDADSDAYLRSAGVTDPADRAVLIEKAQGLPMSLDLCADTYLQEYRTDFSLDSGVLHDRIVRYMNDEEKNLVYLLACLETWTEETARSAAAKAGLAFSPVFYRRLCSFSFMQTEDEVHYRMMHQVQKILRHFCPDSLRKHFLADRKAVLSLDSDPEKYVTMRQIEVVEDAGMVTWLCEEIAPWVTDCLEAFQPETALRVLSNLSMHPLINKNLEKTSSARLFSWMLSSVFYQMERYQEANTLFDQSLDEILADPGIPEERILYYSLISLAARAARFDSPEAIRLGEKIWDALENRISPSFPALLATPVLGAYDMMNRPAPEIWQKRLLRMNEEDVCWVMIPSWLMDTAYGEEWKVCRSLAAEERQQEAVSYALDLLSKIRIRYGEDSTIMMHAVNLFLSIPGISKSSDYRRIHRQMIQRQYESSERLWGKDCNFTRHAKAVYGLLLSGNPADLASAEEGIKLLKEILPEIREKMPWYYTVLKTGYLQNWLFLEAARHPELTCEEWINLARERIEELETENQDCPPEYQPDLSDLRELVKELDNPDMYFMPMALLLGYITVDDLPEEVLLRIAASQGENAESNRESDQHAAIDADEKQADSTELAPEKEWPFEYLQVDPDLAGDMDLLEYLNYVQPARHRDLYFGQKISDKQLRNAIRHYAPEAAGESICGLLDTTLRQTGKDGLLISNQAVYWKGNGNRKIRVPIREMDGFLYDGTIIEPVAYGEKQTAFLMAIDAVMAAACLNLLLAVLQEQ